MTKKQIFHYQDLCRKAGMGHSRSLRHEFNASVLGRVCSVKDFSQEDFDAVKGALLAEIDPSDITAQVRQLNQPKNRLRKAIEKSGVPEAYIFAIMKDKFGTDDWLGLNVQQLTHLLYTISDRRKKFRKRTAAPAEHVESQKAEEVAA